MSDSTGVPLVAAGDVHMHVRSRKALQDVITAVREGKAVSANAAWPCRRMPSGTCGRSVRLGIALSPGIAGQHA